MHLPAPVAPVNTCHKTTRAALCSSFVLTATMSQYTRFIPARLADLAAEEVDIWCWCRSCCHHDVLAIGELIARLGPSFPVPELRRHLRCSGCGSRDVHAQPNWPSIGQVARHT